MAESLYTKYIINVTFKTQRNKTSTDWSKNMFQTCNAVYVFHFMKTNSYQQSAGCHWSDQHFHLQYEKSLKELKGFLTFPRWEILFILLLFMSPTSNSWCNWKAFISVYSLPTASLNELQCSPLQYEMNVVILDQNPTLLSWSRSEQFTVKLMWTLLPKVYSETCSWVIHIVFLCNHYVAGEAFAKQYIYIYIYI